MQGFTYNGKHSSSMGVYFIPDATERGDQYADYEVLDFERAWRPGGEYFHTRVKTRVFNLSCYYEDITIAQKEAIIRWLDRRTEGDLIFDERPYATYFVRPTKKIEFKDYLQRDGITNADRYSGTFTIVLSAYDPFASLNVLSLYSVSASAYARAIAETGLLPSSFTPASPNASSLTNFVVYNPGTEYGHTIIRFAGSVGSSDMTIFNSTTGDKCVLKSGLVTPAGSYIEIDSKTGRMELVKGTERTLYFAFHDEGYIRLAPCMPVTRNVTVKTTASSKAITASSGTFNLNMIGQYIFIEGSWKYIGDYISSSTIHTNTTSSKTASNITTNIVTMNYITVTKASDASITQFEMICKAEVR